MENETRKIWNNGDMVFLCHEDDDGKSNYMTVIRKSEGIDGLTLCAWFDPKGYYVEKEFPAVTLTDPS